MTDIRPDAPSLDCECTTSSAHRIAGRGVGDRAPGFSADDVVCIAALAMPTARRESACATDRFGYIMPSMDLKIANQVDSLGGLGQRGAPAINRMWRERVFYYLGSCRLPIPPRSCIFPVLYRRPGIRAGMAHPRATR